MSTLEHLSTSTNRGIVKSDRICASLDSVTKKFAANAVALNEVTVQLRFGEVTALIGDNGSGKTTLLKSLFGLLRPDSGSVCALELDPIAQSKELRERANYISQSQELDPEMTGVESLEFFSALCNLQGPLKRQRIDAVIEQFELQQVSSRLVGTYSGGEAQRLHLAIGLLTEAELLLLDEPSTGLDPAARRNLWELLNARAETGRAVVIVSHDLEGVAGYAGRVLLMQNGALKIDASPADLIREYGQQVLTIQLVDSPADRQVVTTALKQIEGVEFVESTDDQIVVQLGDTDINDATVIALLNQMGHSIAAYRRDRSLANAYFRITGKRQDPKRGQRERGQRGRGGRRRGR